MRPKIICHMMSSIDGRLLAQRWTPPASGVDPDIVPMTYERIGDRLGASGFIVGRRTMEEFSTVTRGEPSPGPRRTRAAHLLDRQERELAVVVDPRGKLRYSHAHADGCHIVAILSEKVSDAYLSDLRAVGVSYLFAGAAGDALGDALDALAAAFGLKTLLLEGGGRLNGAFLKAGLIDEISLLVYPGIDGLAGVPSIFEYVGQPDEQPASGKSLLHMSTETLEGGVVWLRYLLEREPMPPRIPAPRH